MSKQTIAVVNASGRQAASFIRVASAVGYRVRAQLRNLEGIVASEIADLPNVTVLVGELYTDQPAPNHVNTKLIEELFTGATLAFINTTFYGDEYAIGKALADAAKRAKVSHYIYSSMPDHSRHNPAWPALPLWAAKAKVEHYIRSINLPATFVYTGIYNNNFTSLPYPLFYTDLQNDGSFVWQAPFHPDVKLPWLDAEHDVGPAVLQVVKDGPGKWRGRSLALAFEMLSPREACRLFSRGVGRKVRYVRGPIEVLVPIPKGYQDQLTALEGLFRPDVEDPTQQPPYFGDANLDKVCPDEARAIWEGYRGLEEYAREVFPLEEQANGLTWMNEGSGNGNHGDGDEETEEGGDPNNGEEADDEDEDDEPLTMGSKRAEEEWLA
jgi:hypothetical protein